MKSGVERQQKRIIETKSLFLESENKIDKLLARLTKNKGERVQINETIKTENTLQLRPQIWRKGNPGALLVGV